MLNTVNVIEIPDQNNMAIHQLVSFPDDEEGNIKAEALFTKLLKAKAYIADAEEISNCLEDGYFTFGPYYICIVHSTGTE